MTRYLKYLAAIAALSVLSSSLSFAQGGFSSRRGRADVDSLNIGFPVVPNMNYFGDPDDSDPIEQNRIHVDGTAWNPNTDTIPSEFLDGLTRQIVTDTDDVANSSATYLSVTTRRLAEAFVCRDDNTTNDYPVGWIDTGLDVERTTTLYSCLSKKFSTLSFNIEGNDGNANQFILLVRDVRSPLSLAVPGEILFDQASYTCNELTNCEFTVNRSGGNAGEVSVSLSEGTNPENGILNTTNITWTDGVAGGMTGIVALADVSGDTFMTVDLSSPTGGATLGSPASVTLNITDLDAPPPAATQYFVDRVTGNDSNDGLTFANAWATCFRANSVQPAAGGHVDIFVEGGTYTSDVDCVIDPQFSGTDDTHRVRWKPRTADVILNGPPTGPNIADVITIDVNFISTLRDSGFQFILDGQATQVPGQDANGRIRRGVRITGDDVRVELHTTRTVGWKGVEVTSAAERVELSITSLQHGCLDCGGLDTTGDQIHVRGGPALVEGERTATSTMRAAGHGVLKFGDNDPVAGIEGLIRQIDISNDWTGISTYEAEDGYRVGAIANTGHTGVDDIISRLGGTRPNGISNPNEGSQGYRIAMDASNTTVHRSFFLGSKGECIHHTGSEDQLYFVHNTVVYCDGSAIHSTADDAIAPSKIKIINNILQRTNLSPSTSGQPSSDRAESVVAIGPDIPFTPGSNNWQGVYEVAYNIVPCTSSLSEIFVHTPTDDKQTWLYYETNFPLIFHDNICEADSFDAESVTSDWSNVETNFATSAGSLARGAGAVLTTAVIAGSSSQTLLVADSMYFVDQLTFGDGAAGGPTASGAFLCLDTGSGLVPVEFNDLDRHSNALALVVPQSWANGAGVTVHLPSGCSQDIGAGYR